MLQKLFVASVGALLLVSCASKPKQTEPTAAAAGGEATPAIKDEPMTFSPQGSDSGTIAGLGSVFFEYDQARLTNEGRKQLSTNAEWIKGNPAVTVQVEGHTDDRGSVEYNLSLGERRAKAVKAYLTTLGIDAKRLTIISYGEEKPLQTGDTEAAWSKNRRANFVPLRQ